MLRRVIRGRSVAMAKPASLYRVESESVTLAQIIARTGLSKGGAYNAVQAEVARGPLTWAGLRARAKGRRGSYRKVAA